MGLRDGHDGHLMGSRSHPTDSELIGFADSQDADAAVGIAAHVGRCLACKIKAIRLSSAHISTPDDAAIRRLVVSSPTIARPISDALRSRPAPGAHPASGEIWRIGLSEASLAWVRRVLDDSALVLPVTLDIDLADEYTLLVPAVESPTGTDVAIVASVEGQVDLRAFLQRLGPVQVDAQISQLRLARRNGRLPDTDIPNGPPIESPDDQRLEYRQLLADLLADLSPDGFAEANAEPTEPADDSVDLHQLRDLLRDLTWRRANCQIKHTEIDHVAVDAAHDLLVAAHVAEFDKTVLVTVLTGATPSVTQSRSSVADACGELLSRYPEADDIAVTIADDGWTAVIIAPPFSHAAVEVPSGKAAGPRVVSEPLPVVDALIKHFEGKTARWDESERVRLDGTPTDLRRLAWDATQAAVDQVASEGRRARIPAKKAAYSALGSRAVNMVTEMINAVVSGSASPAEAVDDLLQGDAE
jgi:hypothetical protein